MFGGGAKILNTPLITDKIWKLHWKDRNSSIYRPCIVFLGSDSPLVFPLPSVRLWFHYIISPPTYSNNMNGRGDNWMKIWICTPRIEPWRKRIETIVIKNLKKLLRFFITTDLYSPFLIYIEWLVPDIWPGCGGGCKGILSPLFHPTNMI